MEILLGILMGIAWILIVAFLRSLTTLFHEFGHAIPALVFTQEKVQVFIGTYGKTNNGLNINLGRLKIYFKFNFSNWNIGMCSHQGTEGFWKRFIIILGGPIASSSFTIPLIYVLQKYELNPIWMYVILAFIIAASIDFLVNIIPNSHPIYTQGGSATFNDGFSLLILLSRLSLSDEYLELEQLFNDKEFDELFKKGKILLEKDPKDINTYGILISASIEDNEMDDALFLYQELEKITKLGKSDFLQLGKIYQKLNRHPEAIHYLDQYLYYNYQDPTALTFRGISKAALGNKKEALIDFDAALYNDPENEMALNNKMLLLKQ